MMRFQIVSTQLQESHPIPIPTPASVHPFVFIGKTKIDYVFQFSAKQEADLYDEDLLKYMRKLERGIFKPEKGKDRTISNLEKTKEQLAEEIRLSKSYKTRYTATNSLKWNPNCFLPKLL